MKNRVWVFKILYLLRMLSSLFEMSSTILLEACFSLVTTHRTLFTIADGIHPARGYTLIDQEFFDGVRPPIA
jgi:hypothetical protein